jgi:hypothetical protein
MMKDRTKLTSLMKLYLLGILILYWYLIQYAYELFFPVVAGKTTLISPAPQRLHPVTQATRGIACTKPSEEPQVSTFVAGGSLCALRRHLLAGQFLKPKT